MRGFTHGTGRVRRVLAAHAESQRTGIPVDEVLAGAARPALSRRRLLAGTAGLAAAGVVASAAPAGAAPSKGGPSVAIVGAGLAGIRAAHWLWKVKGIRATVYEASDRVGGRCWTLRGYFDHGQTVERGGAFINTDHNTIRNLVNSLGLTLREVGGGNQPPYGDVYWVDGARYSYDEANADWGEVWRAAKDALAVAPYPQTVTTATPASIALDRMTVDEWIEQNVPGGLASRFGRIMQSNAIAEYGLDPGDQSALNLVYLLGWNSQNSLDPINGSDERFTVDGGNDQIISRMVDGLPKGTIRTGHELVALRRRADGTAGLTLKDGARTVEVVADRVILALPFTLLRDVDLSASGFAPDKLRAIGELGLGANGKIQLQTDRRPWLAQGYGGVSYSPVDQFQCLWDDSVGQPGTGSTVVTADSPGILCQFPGGSATLGGWTGAPFGDASAREVRQVLRWVDPVFPGTEAAFNGRAHRSAWHLHPWSRGAYTCPRPGQYTGLFGIPERPEGPFHFAGEHTSSDYYGFLNGAVESGERAAKEVALA
ncbi:MAG: NAD(P)/FAD-dependent oxidoreductase [Candidatus Nanopelagicales bacterium]